MVRHATFDLDVDQLAVVTASLQSELDDEKLYMVQPEGFDQANGKVLRRALYDLKQSNREKLGAVNSMEL